MEAGKLKERNTLELNFYCRIDMNAENLDFGGESKMALIWGLSNREESRATA